MCTPTLTHPVEENRFSKVFSMIISLKRSVIWYAFQRHHERDIGNPGVPLNKSCRREQVLGKYCMNCSADFLERSKAARVHPCGLLHISCRREQVLGRREQVLGKCGIDYSADFLERSEATQAHPSGPLIISCGREQILQSQRCSECI